MISAVPRHGLCTKTGMIPLLSCDNDVTAWLKDKYKVSGASGARGRLGVTKDAGD